MGEGEGEDPPLTQEACHRIKGWYKAAVDRAPPPDQVTLERITVERVALYSYVPSPGENIPISIRPFHLDDSVPEEGKIEWVVKRLRNNRSRWPSGMRVEHLKRCLAAARKADKDRETAGNKEAETATEGGRPDTAAAQEGKELENWTRVVDLVQAAFQEGKLAEEATWQAVVLIPKGKKDYRFIGLVEVMWKLVAAILNRRLTESITYHDFLRGFRAGCGTGTATLEAKLLQQLAALGEEVLYVIFLDLHKAYDTLDRSRCLEILEGYGIGPRDRGLLQNYWRRLTMVARAGGYYGTDFWGERGVTQGDPLYPTIFNVVVDAVVRHWVTGAIEEAEARWGAGKVGEASGDTILRRRWHGCLVGTRMATGRI